MSFDGEEDAKLAQQLETLAAEREQIKALTHPALSGGLKRLRTTREMRRQVISDARVLRLCDAGARFKMERQLYEREFSAAKVALRTQVLASAAALRRDTAYGIAKPRSKAPYSGSEVKMMKFMRALEKDGLIRLALSPDVVTADLAAVRKGTAADRLPERERSQPVTFSEKIHTSRGILHFHDDVFEKGHTVAIYNNKPGSLPKYHGEVVGINRKEIQVRVSDSKFSCIQCARASTVYICSDFFCVHSIDTEDLRFATEKRQIHDEKRPRRDELAQQEALAVM